MEKLYTCMPLMGMYVGAATMEDSLEAPQKAKNRSSRRGAVVNESD